MKLTNIEEKNQWPKTEITKYFGKTECMINFVLRKVLPIRILRSNFYALLRFNILDD